MEAIVWRGASIAVPLPGSPDACLARHFSPDGAAFTNPVDVVADS
jgi:hypothetical protein